MSQRDGINSQSSVSVYRSNQWSYHESGEPVTVLHDNTGPLSERELSSLRARYIACKRQTYDSALEVEERALLIIARRGEGVDVTERDGPSALSMDIQAWARSRAPLDEGPEENDAYDEVNQFVW